nr:MAG TPA: hypothetical protein [Caudoviricetes sp.]
MMNTRRSILHSVTNIFENVADSKHTKSHTWRILLWIDSF